MPVQEPLHTTMFAPLASKTQMSLCAEKRYKTLPPCARRYTAYQFSAVMTYYEGCNGPAVYTHHATKLIELLLHSH